MGAGRLLVIAILTVGGLWLVAGEFGFRTHHVRRWLRTRRHRRARRRAAPSP